MCVSVGLKGVRGVIPGLLHAGFYLIWHYVKNNFKGNAGHHLLEDSQMPLGVYSTAKASDNDGTHIGEGADDAPGMQPL
jgi:hypothetical protein